MIQAELNGKVSSQDEHKEDFLTSNVFSFMKYADRKVYLRRFLRELGLNEFTDQELMNAEFLFWPIYDDMTQPDIVIICGEHYILFEVKLDSPFGKNQIEREVKGGELEAKVKNKEFHYFIITKEYFFNQDKHPSRCITEKSWTNWQSFTSMLEDILEDKSAPDYDFAEDLLKLLKKKNLTRFNFFKKLYLEKYNFEFVDSVFLRNEIMSYGNKFEGFEILIKSSKDILEGPFKDELFYHMDQTQRKD